MQRLADNQYNNQANTEQNALDNIKYKIINTNFRRKGAEDREQSKDR